MIKTKWLIILISYLFIPSIPHANDSAASLKNSELTYQVNTDIELQKEKLTITKDKVRVEYVFFNHGPEVTLDVAFPLPALPNFEPFDGNPAGPDSDPIFEIHDHLDIISGLKKPGTPWFSPFISPRGIRPFSNFKRTEEGEDCPYEWKVLALDRNGKDITALLKQHKIPLSTYYLNGFMDVPGMELHPEFVAPLKKLGLLVKEDKYISLKANFQTQVIFHWKSTFASKKRKHTTHEYTPQKGVFLLNLNDVENLQPDATSFKEPVSLEFRKIFLNEVSKRPLIRRWMQEKTKTSSQLEVYRVRYILTTGKNWKHRRIGDFTLTVPIPKKTEVFVLGIHGIKRIGNALKVKLKDFSPQQELNIFYVRKIS